MKGRCPGTCTCWQLRCCCFPLISCAMSFVPNSLQPGLPGKRLLVEDDRTGFVSDLPGLCSCRMMTAMFEQVERRSQERMRRELQEGLARLSRNNRRQ